MTTANSHTIHCYCTTNTGMSPVCCGCGQLEYIKCVQPPYPQVEVKVNVILLPSPWAEGDDDLIANSKTAH